MQAFVHIVLVLIFFFSNITVDKSILSKLSELNTIEKKDNELMRVISYNTWGLPIPVAKSDQSFRFRLIPYALNQTNADIICLQETFHPELRNRILSRFNNYNFLSDHECDKRKLLFIKTDCHGGLMTLSKYPVLDESFHEFPISNRGNFIEDIGAKGVLISKIEKGRDTVYILNTHLYAGESSKAESIRLSQLKYINNLIQKLGDVNIILAGDLNFENPEIYWNQDLKAQLCYKYMIDQMGFIDSDFQFSEASCTINPKINPYTKAQDRLKKLDYIMVLNSLGKVIQIEDAKALAMKEWIYSDHLAWLTDIRLTSKIKPKSISMTRYTTED